MEYFQHFQLLLELHGCSDAIYDAMEQDMSKAVKVARDVIKTHCEISSRDKKNEETSSTYRKLGNDEYNARNLAKSLVLYNKALAFAPINSQDMVLAISNRSALLLKLQAYSACIKDIETCFKIGCTAELKEKLETRREKAQQKICSEVNFPNISVFEQLFSTWSQNSIPDIPNTKGIHVKFDKDKPKIVAADNIKIGMILALERPFVNYVSAVNQFTSCHNCLKTSFTLIPCNFCCYALFCDEKCKQVYWDEVHNEECCLMGIHFDSQPFISYKMALKAVLKMKKLSTWPELIAASHKIGSERMKESSISEIFNVNEKFSLLNFKENREPHYGIMFKICFMCAETIEYLNKRLYFPKNYVEREEAIRAFAKIIMHLALTFTSRVEISSAGRDDREDTVNFLPDNYGWFSLTSKLEHKCDANLLVIGLNNQVALISIKSIKKGEQLNVSYVDHAYLYATMPIPQPIPNKKLRAMHLYMTGHICHCIACERTWNELPNTLTTEQRKVYRSYMTHRKKGGTTNYGFLCSVLTQLQSVPYSKEYQAVFQSFIQLLLAYQHSSCLNVMIDSEGTNVNLDVNF